MQNRKAISGRWPALFGGATALAALIVAFRPPASGDDPVAGDWASPRYVEAGVGQPDPRVQCLTACATAFQIQASSDLKQALVAIPSGTSFDFLVKAEWFDESPLAWEYFFGSSILLVSNHRGPQYAVAFYNPFLDAAVLTQWTLDADFRPRIAAAALRAGEELQTGRLARDIRPARWIAAATPGPLALSEQCRRFAADFYREFSIDGQADWKAYGENSEVTLRVVTAHATRALAELYVLQQGSDAGAPASLSNLHAAIAAGDTARLEHFLPRDNPLPAAALEGLPDQFRQRAAPVYAIRGPNEALVFLADPLTLRFCGLAVYRTGPAARLELFDFFDMFAPAP
jgi:hypothetical protein